MDPDPITSPAVYETLRDAQRLGFFGQRPIEELVEHARLFLPPLRHLPAHALVVDLGSGGGAPGLVIADARPDLRVEMIDRRRKRTDFLERAVRRLQMSNARVTAADVRDETRRLHRGQRPFADALTARGFGPPPAFLEAASELLADGGLAVISEPPSGDRWTGEVLGDAPLTPIDGDWDGEASTRSHSSAGVPLPTISFTGGVQVFRRTPRVA